MWHTLSLRAKPDIFTEVSMERILCLMGAANTVNLPQASSVCRKGPDKWGVTNCMQLSGRTIMNTAEGHI